jgi:hypothetical protein
MRDRLGAVNGRVQITSQPGRGTLVCATAPTGRPDITPPRGPEDDQPALPEATRPMPET